MFCNPQTLSFLSIILFKVMVKVFQQTNLNILIHLIQLHFVAGGEGALADQQLLRPADPVPCHSEEVQWWLPWGVEILCPNSHFNA